MSAAAESTEITDSSPPPISRAKRWAFRLTALTLTGLVAAVLLEVCLRIAAPLDVRANSSWYQAHPVYQFRHRGNIDAEYLWVQPYRLHTNSRGLREDVEIPYEPDGRSRIVLHGDSLTFGNGVDAKFSAVRVAEQALAREFPNSPPKLINMGVSAHSPGLELLYYQEEGRKYQPNVVVIMAFCGNDVGDDARHDAFRLTEAGLQYIPHPISFVKRITDTDIYQWFIRRSQLVLRLRQAYNLFHTRVLTRDLVDAQQAIFEDPAAMEKGWPLAEAIWKDFVRRIRSDGAVPVFALLPTADVIDEAAGRPPGKGLLPTAIAARKLMLQMCADGDFEWVDLTPAFVADGRLGIDYFLHEDYHFNERGGQVAGDALAACLKAVLEKTRK